jgi:hypothetical protein
MKQHLYIFLLIAFSFFSCSDRVSAPSEEDDQPLFEITNGEYLKIINPDQFGQIIESEQGSFRDALFVDHQAIEVWGVYYQENSTIKRLSAELTFNQPLLYFMHDDKYLDSEGIGHAAVYAGVPETADRQIDNIYLAVSISDDKNVQDKYFITVQPTDFGQINETVQGPFIEAFFADIEPEDIWSIQQTLPQGTVAKVRLARRINKPIVYYLETDTWTDSSGTTINGSVVGLPYDDIAPQQNIEILIRRTP